MNMTMRERAQKRYRSEWSRERIRLRSSALPEAKAALFFAAVEDMCGEKQMRDGLKELIDLMRGQEVSYDVLRAELEQSSGKNLGDLFRVWLNEKGIPEDFRARYAS